MFFLAVRQLISRRNQTLLTLLGIVLGSAAYVAISGMMLGFQNFIVDQLVNNDAYIRISAREEVLNSNNINDFFFKSDEFVKWVQPPSGRKDNASIVSPQSWITRLEKDPDVSAFSPQIVAQAIISVGHINTAVRVVGSDPEKQKNVSNIESYMLAGKWADLGVSGSKIIVGEDLLIKIGAHINETVTLSVGARNAQPFKIVGVFKLGVKTIDETTVFGSLSDIQSLNQTPGRITDIAIRLHDVTKAADVATTWNLLSEDKVQSWDQANEGIMSVFKTQDIVRNSMTLSILIVAGFGIYNILSLAVTHKKKEIAILRSIGFEPTDIIQLFFVQGLLLGFIGGFVGAGLGFIVSYLMSTIEVSSQRGLGSNHMMVAFDFIIYVKAVLLAVVASSLSGYLPASAAGKLEPIEIIRSEVS